MIRIGLQTQLESVPDAAGSGFDYFELPLNRIAELSEEEFSELTVYLEAVGIRAEALYAMLPDSLPVTGPMVSARLQHEYLESAFDRAHRLGAELIVFDAAASRSVPAGFDFAMARRQLGNFLRIVQGHAAGSGLRIAVQNYRRAECNLINTVSEAALMSALLQLSHVGVLADAVQMALSSEPLDAVERAGSSLMHVHAGCALPRRLPRAGDGEDYSRLFRTLRGMGYEGRVSLVGTGVCTAAEARAALDCIRRALADSER